MDQLDRIDVESKGRFDFVSEVDRMAERQVLEHVDKTYPEHGIVAEESGSRNTDAEYVWIIDPLDGTTNFLHGYPHFAVSIAITRRGVLEHGVIYQPVSNELFTASRGQGAQLNNRRIRASRSRSLERSLLATGLPGRRLDLLDASMRTFRAALPRCSGVRRSGSAALDLAYVAAGRLDGYWEMGLAPWDMAAGALLVREAGGLVADIDGSQGYLESGNIIAGASPLFNTFHGLIRARNG